MSWGQTEPMKTEDRMNTITLYLFTWSIAVSGIFFNVICSPAFSGAEEGGVSTDEDAPYRDDLNDQSYDPKGER